MTEAALNAWHDYFVTVAQVSATLAGLLFVGLTEALRVAPELRMIAYGFFLLGLVFWFPNGFAPLIGRFWSFLERRK